MKSAFSILLIFILMETCNAQSWVSKSDGTLMNSGQESVDAFLLNFYRQYSPFTDPGEYAYLYKDLPESLPELCSFIKSQFLHSYEDLPKYREQIPKERWNEAFSYPSVKLILKGLLSHDPAGFVLNRKPEARLILGCNQNAIVLASILKYREIPARVRSGHATYIMPGFHISHTVCEVWNEKESRWMLVDPSTGMIDFSREKFDYSNEAWLKLQNGEIDPNLFGIPRRYTGLVSIVAKVCTDLASVLGTEYPIDQYAPILDDLFKNNQLNPEQIKTLNRISELMKSINADNINQLKEIYDHHPEFQITKSFQQ